MSIILIGPRKDDHFNQIIQPTNNYDWYNQSLKVLAVYFKLFDNYCQDKYYFNLTQKSGSLLFNQPIIIIIIVEKSIISI